MTSGWSAMTSGPWRQSARGRLIAAWLLFLAIGAVNMAVNAASVVEDRATVGRPVAAWQPWTWEVTSFAAWAVLVPLIFLATRHVRPPRVPLLPAIGLHLLFTVLASLAHVGLMVAMRHLVYWAQGGSYRISGALGEVLLYEYRKDVVTYLWVALIFLLLERVLRPGRVAESPPHRIEVKDGSRTRWIAPQDLEWAQSAGNYVELHGRFGTLLHRSTLAALAEELAPHGFRRIHRGRLVRADAVAAQENKSSGDFELVMTSGVRLAGSRRYR